MTITREEVLDLANEYVEYLNAPTPGSSHSFKLAPARKYIKVLMDSSYGQESVHAFIVAETGELVKAATFRAPQKNSDGTLAVRFDLTDESVRTKLYHFLSTNPSKFTGGYLYKDFVL